MSELAVVGIDRMEERETRKKFSCREIGDRGKKSRENGNISVTKM